jgi:dipeptidyl aminopeptidase/acylaminoacyl peptidase
MISRSLRTAAVIAALLAPALLAQTRPQVPASREASGAAQPTGYMLPPQNVVDVFDAEPLPQAMVSPNHQVMALISAHPHPSIAELAQPMLRLAGDRISPKTNGPRLGGNIYKIVLKTIATGADTNVTLPAQPRVSNVRFSPDGSHLSFLNTKDATIEVWVATVATGAAKMVSGTERANATAGDPCDWLKDNVTLVCEMVPAGRGPAPKDPEVPSGPNVQENLGKAAPAPTYEDLLKTLHDDELFQYYFTSQLVAINTATAAKASFGHPAIFSNVTPSPSGDYVLVTTIKRPFSHLMPMNGFPQSVEVWARHGGATKTLAEIPSREGTPLTGVEPGPRGHQWRSDQPATIVWEEALDGGDQKNKVPFRDKVLTLDAPFTAEPHEFAKTEWRYGGLQFTDKGLALLTENDRASRHTRTWLLEPGAQPRQVWDRKTDAVYENPGAPISASGGGGGRGGGRGGGGGGPILQNGDVIYLSGEGATPEGDRPFVDRLNVKTLKTDRIFRSDASALETFVAPLSDDMNRFLIRSETPKDPPNYYAKNRDTTTKRPVTGFKDPEPQIRGITSQFVTYKRKDGVTLSGTLYLPAGYQKGTKLPVIMWAYPREFGDADTASQITGSPNRFTTVSGYSHLFLLLSGYAVFDNPTMPIIGPGETANDHYVEQLVASAEAAVDQVVSMGVGDRDRIGVGGHSYGAFMTANLLAHSRLFRAGFAESGAYNRSLTPFGFQNERRTFWQVPELYAKMSPFWYADKIKDPILLMHGEMDDNSGTFPINSERLYMALKGFGATVRYVTLPYEAHGYVARETLLHVLWERLNWFDKYVKNAPPRDSTATQK